MKITIQPTEDQTGEKHPYNTVSIESAQDGLILEDVLEIIHSALVAYGYVSDGVVREMNNFEL